VNNLQTLGQPHGLVDKPGPAGGGQIALQAGRMYATNTNHDGKWNYLFCDGHVETLLPEETIGPLGSTTGDPMGMWTRDPND
jgi:prepilin-type processing-associated H-X9-DG protein